MSGSFGDPLEGFEVSTVIGDKIYSREDVLQYFMTGRAPRARPVPKDIQHTMLRHTSMMSQRASAIVESKESQYQELLDQQEHENNEKAGIYNSLGKEQLKFGKLDEAEENFKKALDIFSEGDTAHQHMQEFLAASSREYLAQVAEARGDFKAAKAVRLSFGKEKVHCGNDKCFRTKFLKIKTIKTCIHCKRCKSVFYCSTDCKHEDWEARHRAWCYDKKTSTSSPSI